MDLGGLECALPGFRLSFCTGQIEGRRPVSQLDATTGPA
jgi:hypothetical protein